MDRLQQTLDSLDFGIARFDHDLRLAAWNVSLFEMLDYPGRLARPGTSFLDFVAYNIDRGEHGDLSRDIILQDRLAHRFRNYVRRRACGALLTVRSLRCSDGGFLKLFTQTPKPEKSGPLSKREKEALSWAARGKTALETARIMGIAERTVEFHLTNAIARLGAANKVHAVAWAVSLGMVEP